MIETDRWPVTTAKWFTAVSPDAMRRKVRVIVLHDMEADEAPDTAQRVADYFATTATKASAHVCVDNTHIIQCVLDNDVAWAAPGCNSDGIQIEMAGYGAQTRSQWTDPYSLAMLENAANVAAQYCLKYTIPPVRLTDDQLSNGDAGLVGHVQVSTVYQRSDHTDPGPNFPWDLFMDRVVFYHHERLHAQDSSKD